MRLLFTAIIVFLNFCCYSQTAVVGRIIDGDTFETEDGERIRMLGIDTPERGDEYFDEATEHLTSLIAGKSVTLIPDNISDDIDVFGRSLRYVFLDSLDIDKQMILDGWSGAYTKYAFDKQDEYIEAEKIAKSKNIGIWQPEEMIDIVMPSSKTPFRKYFLIVSITILVIIGGYYYFKK